MNQERKAAVAGIYEYPLRVAPGVAAMEIKAESARKALEDAGLSWSDVDGLYDAGDGEGGGGLGLAAYLGIRPTVNRHHAGGRVVVRVPRGPRDAGYRGGQMQGRDFNVRLDGGVGSRCDRGRADAGVGRAGSRTWRGHSERR